MIKLDSIHIDSATNKLPLIPIPNDLKNYPIPFTENGKLIFEKRYIKKNDDGSFAETHQETFWRVCFYIASADRVYGKSEKEIIALARCYFEDLANFKMIFNSPLFTGAGTELGMLAACIVMPIEDDMGANENGIFDTLKNAVLAQKTGAGLGFSFSRLRPKNSLVKTSKGMASGPISFLKVYDAAFDAVAQGGCLIPSTYVYTEEGMLTLDEIIKHTEVGWESHDINVATQYGLKKSKSVFNNGVSKTIKIVTKEGLEITGTPEHKLQVMSEKGPIWKQFNEIQKNDWLISKLGQHQGKTQKLQHPDKELIRHFVDVSFPETITNDLAFLLGYMAGDGHNVKNRSIIGFSVSHTSYLMDELPQIIKRVFGENLHVEKLQSKNQGCVNYVIDNKIVYEFMKLNGFLKPYSECVSIPKLIRQSHITTIGYYISGLFEADGYVQHGFPTIGVVSEKLIKDLAYLLIGIGIPVYIRKHIKFGKQTKGKLPIYRLSVRSSIGLDRWNSVVFCDSRSRFIAVKNHKTCYKEQNYIIPFPEYWLENVLDAVPAFSKTKDKNYVRMISKRWINNDHFTYRGYSNLSSKYSVFGDNAKHIDDRWFVQVKSIEDAGEQLTFDIEVDDIHEYIANGIVSHNSRRGANLAALDVSHPDIQEFIHCKEKEGEISNFNISVGITDDFMQAVENNDDWNLIDPNTKKITKTMKAIDLFNEIAQSAWIIGDPGMLFLDTANKRNSLIKQGRFESTNPCGEFPLLPFDNCSIGTINLAKINIKENNTIDWDGLRKMAYTVTDFLDHLIDANAYVESVPQLAKTAKAHRRIGVSMMGFGDLLFKLKIRYGSPKAIEFASQLQEFVTYCVFEKSIELSKEKGAFPDFMDSYYNPDDFKFEKFNSIVEYKNNFDRPNLDWDSLIQSIKQNGLRHAELTAQVPNGATGVVSGVSCSGIEPLFALAYKRNVDQHNLELNYVEPLFQEAIKTTSYHLKDDFMNDVLRTGSCQNVLLPQEIKDVFVVANDLSYEEHILMQAAFQAFASCAISKTINMPFTATVEDVKKAYMLAWKLGCKGITIYRNGSRQIEVLETAATKESKNSTPVVNTFTKNGSVTVKRPTITTGKTISTESPVGKVYLTVNKVDDQPFETFVNVAKSGTEIAAVAEAIGRLISLNLRLNDEIDRNDRLIEVMHQLENIGSTNQIRNGHKKMISSLPAAIAFAIDKYLESNNEGKLLEEPSFVDYVSAQDVDLCPSCGHASLVKDQGCATCRDCGYAKC